MNRWGTLCIALVGLCAIDWYRPDGSQLNEGDYVYTKEQVEMVVKMQVAANPGYTHKLRCEE